MAMDDVSGGGGGVYTPTWRREEEEREWAAAQEEKRRAERHESAGYSYNPDDDPRAHAQMTYQTASGTYTTPKVYGKAEQETGMSWEAPESDSGMMINNDAENRDDQGSGSWDQVSGTEQGAGTKTQLPMITVAEPESKEEIKGSGKKAEEEKPVVYTGGSTNANTGTGAKGTGASGTKAALTENGLPEGYMDWTAEQWKEWQRDSANREAAAAAANRQAEAARAERAREEYLAAWQRRQAEIENRGSRSADQGASDAYRGRELMQPISYSGTTGTGTSQSQSPGRDYYSSNPEVRRYTPGTAEYNALNGRGSRTQGYDPAIRSAGGGQSAGPAVGSQQWLVDNGLSWAGNTGSGGRLEGARYSGDYPAYNDGGWNDRRYDANTGFYRGRELMNYGGSTQRPETVDVYSQAYQDVIQNGGTEREAEIEATKALVSADKSDPIGNWFRESQKDVDVYNAAYGETYADAISKGSNERDAETAAMKAAEQAANNNRVGTPGNQRYDARQGQSNGPAAGGQEGLSYNGGSTSLTEAQRQFEADEAAGKYTTEIPNHSYQIPGTETYAQAEKGRQAGANTNTARQGAEALMNTWDGNSNYRVGTPGNQRYDARLGQTSAAGGTGSGEKDQAAKAGTGGTNSKGTGTGTSTKGSGNDKAVPDGSKYYNPSYGQGGKVVKAPYKKGGYSEEEIRKMGNASRTDFKYNKGEPAFEGYYLAPDGKYYPVDQEKANYYNYNGHSYRGWEEGMRDYWNTFGTFYGYRPDWKTAGRNVSKGSGGGRGGYSYGGGGSSYAGSNRSYGAGSTANNGLYWNPNTSWNI